jgi:hypothetical protein
MQARKPNVPLDQHRRAWREAHLRGVVCEGWIEGADGKWSAKAC